MEQLMQNTDTDSILKEAACWESRKEYSQAIKLYNLALANNKQVYGAYYHLGAIYERLQENEKAKDIYAAGIKTARSFHDKKIETDLSFTLLGLIED